MAKAKYFDWKNADQLQVFLTPHARISSSKKTKLDKKSQRALAKAVKHARFMGLLPYVQD